MNFKASNTKINLSNLNNFSIKSNLNNKILNLI